MQEFLAQEGVEFEAIDIMTLTDPWATLRAITGGPVATPTVAIGDEAFVGFNPSWIKDRLAAVE